MTKLEQLARSLAASVGHDPDMMICPGEPQRVILNSIVSYAIFPQGAYPIWHSYAIQIRNIFKLMDKERISFLDSKEIMETKI